MKHVCIKQWPYCGVCCRPLLLLQLNKEKVDLENRLEAEQEYIVNKLRKQVGCGRGDTSNFAKLAVKLHL